jgi:hypothetical protein
MQRSRSGARRRNASIPDSRSGGSRRARLRHRRLFVLGLVHSACLAIIERSALVTTAFTVVGKQILHVRENYRARVDTEDGTPPSVSELMRAAEQPEAPHPAYWGQWTLDFDYLYVLFTDAHYKNPDPARLTAIYAGNRFVLYKIHRT